MRLLFAEDEKELSGAQTVILRHNGYDIDPVYDGAEALSRLLQGGYDAAILDIMMPRMDGLSVLRNILANFLIYMIILMVNGNLGAESLWQAPSVLFVSVPHRELQKKYVI